jgi:transglutaminase-like putative cysteine protease
VNLSSAVRTAVAAWLATMLASLTIFPLVQGQSWYLGLGLLAALVAVAGLVVRRFTSSAGVVVAVQIAVWVIAVSAVFLPGAAYLGLLPGPEAVAAGRTLLSQGLTLMHRAAPPVPDTPGVVFVTTTGLALVALTVDVIAVTLRRPAVAGLPLLATYCVPAAVLTDGLDWTLFLFAAGGFLVLVGVDSVDRVQAWGRMLGGAGRGGPASSAWGTGLDGARGIAAASLAAAVLVPVFVPGIGERALTGSGSGPGPGRGSVTVINPFLDLRKDLADQSDEPIITYRTNVRDPQPMRIVVDDVFTGDTWEPSRGDYLRSQRVQDGLQFAPGLSSTTPTEQVTTTVTVLGLGQHYLPLPYPWRKVEVAGGWYYDASTLNVVGDGVTAKDLRYTVEHYLVQPTPQELQLASQPSSQVTDDLNLPTIDPRIRQIARQRAGSGTPYEQATRLRNWLRTFAYSTQAPGYGRSDGGTDAVLQFLDRRSGYCVHFASAMAVMARTLGIPARVAVGFLPGLDNGDGTWTVRVKDAHAWPELYFEGVGWIRFEPTPPLRTGGVGDVVGGGRTDAPDTTVTPSATAPTPSASRDLRADRESQADRSAAGTSAQPSLWRRVLTAIPWPWLAAMGVALLLTASPAAVAALYRRRRWRRSTTRMARAEAALDELSERLTDLGVQVSPALTPRGLRQWLVGAEFVPTTRAAPLDRLVAELESARYAPPGGIGPDAAQLRADVRQVAHVVADQVPARRRRLARLVPATGVAIVTGAAARTAEAAGGGAGRRGADQVDEEVRKPVGPGRRR